MPEIEDSYDPADEADDPLVAVAKAQIIDQGPCAFCGGPWAAHRVIDAQMGRVAAGESIEDNAHDYGVTVEQMVSKWIALMDLLYEKAVESDA